MPAVIQECTDISRHVHMVRFHLKRSAFFRLDIECFHISIYSSGKAGMSSGRFQTEPVPKIRCVCIYSAPQFMDAHLLAEEKLAILQAADPRRRWHSLDDRRVCVLCGRAITGRQIDITRDSLGSYSLHCPTPGCPSLPNDWFYLGNAYSNPKHPEQHSSEANFFG